MRTERGITLIEIMIVLALIALAVLLGARGLRAVTGADLADDTVELAQILRQANQAAVETGQMHRVVFDLDEHAYLLEICEGQTTLTRGKDNTVAHDASTDALERGRERLRQLPQEALAIGTPEDATRMAAAVAGHHIADRVCSPSTGFDVNGKPLMRALRQGRGNKFRTLYVQHLDDAVTKGRAAIYFFPMGAAEKAVIELTNGDDDFAILVHGLTGAIEVLDSRPRNIDDHMLRNVHGDKDAER